MDWWCQVVMLIGHELMAKWLFDGWFDGWMMAQSWKNDAWRCLAMGNQPVGCWTGTPGSWPRSQQPNTPLVCREMLFPSWSTTIIPYYEPLNWPLLTIIIPMMNHYQLVLPCFIARPAARLQLLRYQWIGSELAGTEWGPQSFAIRGWT